MDAMNNVTIKVTVEILQRRGASWEHDTIAKSQIEDVSCAEFGELDDRMADVCRDALARAHGQLNNTRRIRALVEKNKLLAHEVRS